MEAERAEEVANFDDEDLRSKHEQASASIRNAQDQWDADVRMERTERIDLEDSPRAVVEEDAT